MDFPAAEKCYSHVSLRRPSDSSLEESSQPETESPVSSWSQHDFDAESKVLTPAATRATIRPTLSRNVSRQMTKVTTSGTILTLEPEYEVDFAGSDPDDPRNWPIWYKAMIIFTISFGTLVVVLYSTSYTSTIGALETEFNITSDAIITLGVTTYLFGLATGSLILAPISETYGRKPVYTIAMFCFVIMIIPAALANNITTIIVVRFFGAIAGSAMIANAPGTVGDIISDRYRATAFSIWSIGPMNGPVVGPVIGGFVTQYAGWRWANWVVMIAGGIAFGLICCTKETYAPTLLQQKAKKLRKSEDDERYWSRYDVRVGFLQLMKVNLSRPFVMAVTEPICIFWNVYIAIIYGILYLCFVAYPIVFTQGRGWSVGLSGLSFLGIGIGTMITICSAGAIRRMIEAHKVDPKTGERPPESMMSVVFIAAICIPVGQIWFAWTCYPTSIHWAVSIAAGIPIGAGNGAVFIYASNYLVHSYGIYAASAMAGNAVMRSLLGGTLPLAGPSMYRALGPNWASMLLGLLEVLIIPIPFIFYKFGGRIREKSTLISQMRENEERQERKRRRAEERARRLANGVSGNEPDADEKQKEKEVEAEEKPRQRLPEIRLSSDSTENGSNRDIEKEAEAELARIEGIEAWAKGERRKSST